MSESVKGNSSLSRKGNSESSWPKFRMPHKYVLYDKIHRGTVFVLASVAVIFSIRLGLEATHHFRVRRPILQEIARIDKEAQMEKMQAQREDSTVLQQKLQEEANKV